MTSPTNRLVGLIVGAGFVLLAALSLAPGLVLGLFSTSLTLAAVHFVIGLGLGIGALSPARHHTNAGFGTALLVLGLAGLFLIDSPSNLFDLNAATNLVHFASAAVLLTVGLGADRPRTTH